MTLTDFTHGTKQKRCLKSEFRNTHFSFTLGVEGIEQFVATPELHSDEAIDPEYHQPGDRCLLQTSGDELVGLTWVTSGPLAYLSHGAYYNLPDDICYTYNPHTSTAHNELMCRALRDRAVLDYLGNEGKRRLLTAMNESDVLVNRVAQYGYEHVGHIRMRARRGRLRLSVDVKEDFWCFERRT